MHCTDTGVSGAMLRAGSATAPSRLTVLAAAAAALWLAGCAESPRRTATGAAPPSAAAGGGPPGTPATGRLGPRVVLAPPRPARDWDDFRLQAAQRMMAANPEITYTGPVPEPLLAIPVLEIELDRRGNVRHIEILRVPTQATDTIDLAVEAVRRAAPYGDMSGLPQPWKFAEVFLFDDDRRFKPRTLDID